MAVSKAAATRRTVSLMPERHSADDFDRSDQQGYDEAYVQEMARYVVL